MEGLDDDNPCYEAAHSFERAMVTADLTEEAQRYEEVWKRAMR